MTKIEWATLGLARGVTWNPIRARNASTGKRGWHCERVSEACRNCYAEALNAKAGDTGGTGLPYKPGHRQNGDVEIYLDEKTLLQPLSWRAPRGVFVCSMTDIFGDWVKDEWLDRIFAVMALCPQHRFALLTKRPKRMREFISGVPSTIPFLGRMPLERVHIEAASHMEGDGGFMDEIKRIANPYSLYLDRPWPLPNVWLGVTAEDQQRADERIPDLLATPAAVRFVSIEPMLSGIDLTRIGISDREKAGQERGYYIDALAGHSQHGISRLDWVITGGESSKDARGTPCALFRSIRDQCATARVAHFHKQNGEWIDADELWRTMRAAGAVLYHSGKIFNPEMPLNYQNALYIAEAAGFKRIEHQSDGSTLIRVGKARAGRFLDGESHSEFPEAR